MCERPARACQHPTAALAQGVNLKCDISPQQEEECAPNPPHPTPWGVLLLRVRGTHDTARSDPERARTTPFSIFMDLYYVTSWLKRVKLPLDNSAIAGKLHTTYIHRSWTDTDRKGNEPSDKNKTSWKGGAGGSANELALTKGVIYKPTV